MNPTSRPRTDRLRHATRPPGHLRLLTVFALATVGASLGTLGASRARPPGVELKAVRTRAGAAEFASATDGCRTALLREEASRARAQGFGTLAIPLRIEDDAIDVGTARRTAPPPLPPGAIARRLAAARPALRAEKMRALLLLELPRGGDCGSRVVRRFVDRWHAALRAEAVAATDAAPGKDRPRDHGASDPLASTVLCRRDGGPVATFDAGSGAGVPDAIVDTTSDAWLGNGDFRRGWERWRTSGAVALDPPAEPISEACYPLVARIDPGGAIVQALGGGFVDQARDVGDEEPAAGPESAARPSLDLVIEVLPDPALRTLRVRTGEREQEIVVGPSLDRVTVVLAPPPAPGEDLGITVPAGAPPVALTALRLGPPGSAPPVVAKVSEGEVDVEPAPWQVLPVASPDPAHAVPGSDGGDFGAHASIDLSDAPDLGPVRFAPDEMNAWKLYVYFGPDRERPGLDRSPGWLRRILPWVSHLRFPAALGGNFCGAAPRPCRTVDRTHPGPGEIDCFDAPVARPMSHEILRDDVDPPRLDFSTWGRTVDEVVASGMLPHLNVSSAPCAFTDGYEYTGYRWNQRPVVRHAEWRSYVRDVAREIARRPSAPGWRFSIVNEPNCRWVLGERLANGRHRISMLQIGYAGDAKQYATQYAETAAEILGVLPDAWVQLGNFTIGGGSPLEDNLPQFLAAVDGALGAEGVDPGRLRALSLSLYETPQHGLDEIPALKFGRLARWIGPGSRFRSLPIKLDEVGVMDLVANPFRKQTGVDLQATRWTAAWHAELIGLAIDRDMISSAPWLTQMFADREMTEPRPFYWTYALAALALGSVRPADGDLAASRRLEPVEPGTHPARRLRSERLASSDPDGVGHVVLEDPADGSLWILAWRHDATPATDPTVDARGKTRLDLRVAAPGGPTAGVATVISLDGTGRGAPWSFEPFRKAPTRVSSLEVHDGMLALDVAAESVQLVHLDGRGT
ncbi:MAG: hypothetical protein RL698_1114 [Pseudomonadota bacterium]